MDNEILFTEIQRFKQWWLWLLLIGINVLFFLGILWQLVLGRQFGDHPMGIAVLLIVFLSTLLLTLLFYSLRLVTQIKQDGIYVRFYPFHFSFRFYPWNDISKCFVRDYSPIGEYGGWGIRMGRPGKGRALNVSGNKGLQLELNNHKKLLIGTNKPEDLTSTLIRLGKLRQ